MDVWEKLTVHHPWKKPLEAQICSLRRWAEAIGKKNPVAVDWLLVIARNLEEIMTRIEKIVAAELTARSALQSQLAAANAAALDPASATAINTLAAANGLEPTTGEPLPAPPTAAAATATATA